MKTLIAATIVCTAAAFSVAPAFADSRDQRACTSEPEANWQPIAAAEQAVQKLGYVVTRSSVKRGCYEFHVTKSDQRFELHVDPATTSVVRTQAK
jgi:hypothetical protein